MHCFIAPWLHCTIAPLHHGTIAPLHHGTMAPWHHGTMALLLHCTMAPWHHCTIAPWHHGTIAPLHHCSIASLHHCTIAPLLPYPPSFPPTLPPIFLLCSTERMAFSYCWRYRCLPSEFSSSVFTATIEKVSRFNIQRMPGDVIYNTTLQVNICKDAHLLVFMILMCLRFLTYLSNTCKQHCKKAIKYFAVTTHMIDS